MRLPLALIALPLLLLISPRATAQPTDPAPLTPSPSPPAFRDLVSVSDWDKAADHALGKMAHPENAKPTVPAVGERVLAVRPDSPAAQLGIVAGDAITEVDGISVANAGFNALRSEDHDQQITLVNGGAVRQLTIHPGPIGVRLNWFFRPILTYLRGKTRDPRWDKYVFVALANDRSNPALAETAWAAALSAGYQPDWLSDFAGADIAWRDRRNDDALAFCAQLQSRDFVPAEVRSDDLAYQLAIANFKIPQALARRIAPNPGPPTLKDAALVDHLTALLKQHQALPEADRLAPSPMELAAQGETDILPDMNVVPGGNDPKFDRRLARSLASHEPLGPWDIETDSFYAFMETPKADTPDAHLTLHFNAKPHDHQYNDYARCIVVGLVNCDDPDNLILDGQPKRGSMLTVNLELPGHCWISTGLDPHQLTLQDLSVKDELDQGRECTLHLLHAAGRQEVWLNHRRLLYLPAPEHPAKVGFYLGVVGCTLDARLDFTRIGK